MEKSFPKHLNFFTKAPISFAHFKVSHCKLFELHDLPQKLTMKQALTLSKKLFKQKIARLSTLNSSDLLLAHLRKGLRSNYQTTYLAGHLVSGRDPAKFTRLHKYLNSSRMTLGIAINCDFSRQSWKQLSKIFRTKGQIEKLLVELAPVEDQLSNVLQLISLVASKNDKQAVEVNLNLPTNVTQSQLQVLTSNQAFIQFAAEFKICAKAIIAGGDELEPILSPNWFSSLDPLIATNQCSFFRIKDQQISSLQHLQECKRYRFLNFFSEVDDEGKPLYSPVKIEWPQDSRVQFLMVHQSPLVFESVFNSTFPFQWLNHLYIKATHTELKTLAEHISKCSQLKSLYILNKGRVFDWLEKLAHGLRELSNLKHIKIGKTINSDDAKILTELNHFLPNTLQYLSLSLRINQDKTEFGCKARELIDSVFSFSDLVHLKLYLHFSGSQSQWLWNEDDLTYFQSKIEKAEKLRALETKLSFRSLKEQAIRDFINTLNKKFVLGDLVKVKMKVFDEKFNWESKWAETLEFESYSQYNAKITFVLKNPSRLKDKEIFAL